MARMIAAPGFGLRRLWFMLALHLFLLNVIKFKRLRYLSELFLAMRAICPVIPE